MKRLAFWLIFIVVVSVVFIRFYPTDEEMYRDIAHYAVAVRKNSQCDTKQTFTQRLNAELAYVFIISNQLGYENYKLNRRLLLFTVGKVKCQSGQVRFELESERAIRAIRFALESGENINEINALGQTPLHAATWANNHYIVEYLIRAGADQTIETPEGKTALEINAALLDMDYPVEQVKNVLESQI